jgi:hypothetical protein
LIAFPFLVILSLTLSVEAEKRSKKSDNMRSLTTHSNDENEMSSVRGDRGVTPYARRLTSSHALLWLQFHVLDDACVSFLLSSADVNE